MESFIIEGVGIWHKKEECHICGNGTKGELYECERCGELFCENCQTQYNQFSQIDYACCESCGSRNYE